MQKTPQKTTKNKQKKNPKPPRTTPKTPNKPNQTKTKPSRPKTKITELQILHYGVRCKQLNLSGALKGSLRDGLINEHKYLNVGLISDRTQFFVHAVRNRTLINL